jgi:hypothetical protein
LQPLGETGPELKTISTENYSTYKNEKKNIGHNKGHFSEIPPDWVEIIRLCPTPTAQTKAAIISLIQKDKAAT